MQKPYTITKLDTKKDVSLLDNLLSMLFSGINPATTVASDNVSTFISLTSPDGTKWYLTVNNSGVASWQNTRP